MIKKLKLKFILTNMTLISIVMLAAFSMLYFNTANELEENSISAMKDIARNDHRKLDSLFEPKPEGDKNHSYLSTYTIDLDEHTNTCFIDGFGDVENLTEDKIKYINGLIYSVKTQENNEGVLEEYNMRYFYTETPSGLRIVLLDKGYEDDSLSNLLVSFATIGSIAFTAFLIISVIVARIAVKPVAESIKQQKQLVSDISHELKTPITIISTNTDIVLSHNESTVDSERKWLGYIKDETKRMSELVSMMLYLAKTDESGVKPSLVEFDLSNSAFEITLPFESICFENSKTFSINIEPNIKILGDEASVKQLMVILLDNAVKYSNDNGRIEFTLKSNADKAIMSVFNTGLPIPKENIPHLFDRFYRIEESRSRDKGGSGLGLSIAKRIIENNKASISVTSDMDHGTVFSCTFDIAKQKKK